MAFLSGSNNRFEFSFPISFVPDWIAEKYNDVINKLPDYPVNNVLDFINLAVQGISLPLSVQQVTIEQTDMNDRDSRHYRSSMSIEDMFQKDFKVTVRLDQSYLMYFIMLDLYFYYFATFKEKHLPEAFMISVLDNHNTKVYDIKLKEVLFTNVQGIDLDFSSKTVDLKKAELSFKVNNMSIILNGKEFAVPDEYKDQYVF